MFQPLDGPSAQSKISVDNTVKEVKIGASPLEGRKVITLQPLEGHIRVYFGDDTASPPSASDVLNKGFRHFKYVKDSYEAGSDQPVFYVTESGSAEDVIVAERG